MGFSATLGSASANLANIQLGSPPFFSGTALFSGLSTLVATPARTAQLTVTMTGAASFAGQFYRIRSGAATAAGNSSVAIAYQNLHIIRILGSSVLIVSPIRFAKYSGMGVGTSYISVTTLRTK
jgi:hypothetical protein